VCREDAEDGDWADGLWEIWQRLVMVAIMEPRTWSCRRVRSPKATCPGGVQKGWRSGISDWTSKKGNSPNSGRVAVPVPGRRDNQQIGANDAAKGMLSMTFLTPQLL